MGLVGVVLLSVLADILLPSGQTNKYIKGIFSLLVLLTLLTPMIKLKNADFNLSDIIGENVAIDYEFIENVQVREITEMETKIEEELNNRGIKTEKVVLTVKDGNINSIMNVSIQIKDIVDADAVKNMVSEMLSINKDAVSVYE